MQKLELAFLGSPEIRLNDQIITLPTRKALALLAYLAVERHAHSREQLMALLWPESDLKRAQDSLRTTLAYIRKTLPNAPLVIERDSVAFESHDQTTLDIDWLQAASLSASRLPLKQFAQITPLQGVARQIRGDFLAGFNINDSSEFDDWMAGHREHYHQQITQIFETLSRLQLEAGFINDGLESTQHWLELAPLDENAYLRQMQLHLANGNRLAALQTYKLCCLMLTKEFGLQASPQTHALAQQAQNHLDSERRVFDSEAECIALNRMATAAAQSSYDLETALNLLRQALSLAKKLENPLHLAETNWNLSHTYFYQGNLETALLHGETAVSLARSIQRDDLLGRALNTIAYVKLWSGSSVQAIDTILDEAIAIFQRLHQPGIEVDCLTIKANVRLSYGYPQESLLYAQEALTLSEQIQNDWGYASASYNMGLALLDAGDIRQAAEICEKGITKARIAGHPPLVFFNTLVLGHIYRSWNRLDAAFDLHKESDKIADTLKSPYFQLLIMTELCADYACLNQWSDAARCALHAGSIRLRVPYSDYARWHEIEALFHGGYEDFALAELQAMREKIIQEPTHRRLPYFLERALAVRTEWQNQPEQMTAHLMEAERLAGDFGFLTEQKNIRKLLASI